MKRPLFLQQSLKTVSFAVSLLKMPYTLRSGSSGINNSFNMLKLKPCGNILSGIHSNIVTRLLIDTSLFDILYFTRIASIS